MLLRIDTPGGLDTSMREIDAAELASKVPVITYVAPDGARSASAGVFVVRPPISPAWHRRPTSARRPRSGRADLPAGDLKNKIVNDAAARIRALATTHERNADWAEKAVREAANATAAEALQLHVVEIVATDTQDLLRQANGRTTIPKGIKIDLTDAKVETHTLPLHLQILDVLIDPNLISLLFLGGLILIAFEVAHPGMIFPGFAGGMMLVLALFGISVVPFTWTGLLLLLVGAGLMLAEVHVGTACSARSAWCCSRPARSCYSTTTRRASRSRSRSWSESRSCSAPGFVFLISRTRAVRQPAAGHRASTRWSAGAARCARRSTRPASCSSTASCGRAVSDGEPIQAGEDVVVERLEGITLHVQPAPMEESLP